MYGGMYGRNRPSSGGDEMAIDDTRLHTRIVTKVMEAAYRLDKAGCDKERLCYLVTDEEWRQLIRYARQFDFDSCSLPAIDMKTFRFAGIEIIKRSSLA